MPPIVTRRSTARGNRDVVDMRGLENSNADVFLMHSTLTWISHFLWSLFISFKLVRKIDMSWSLVFWPTWLYHTIQILFQIGMLKYRRKILRSQLGPPPTEEHGPEIMTTYNDMFEVRMRTHIVNNTNFMIDSFATLLVKIIFVVNLERVESGEGEWGSFWLIFLPSWISWVATNVIARLRQKEDRGSFGSIRDLQYIFMLFLASKLDGVNDYSWVIVFMVPWLVFGVMFLVAVLLFLLLLFTTASTADTMLQLGIFCMAAGFTPMYVFFMRLAMRLDGHEDVSVASIMLPNVCSWLAVWTSSLILWYGLRLKDRRGVNHRVLNALVALQNHQQEQEAASGAQATEKMTDEEIAKVCEGLAEGKIYPSELVRVGSSFFQRLRNASSENLTLIGDIEEGNEEGNEDAAADAADAPPPRDPEAGPSSSGSRSGSGTGTPPDAPGTDGRDRPSEDGVECKDSKAAGALILAAAGGGDQPPPSASDAGGAGGGGAGAGSGALAASPTASSRSVPLETLFSQGSGASGMAGWGAADAVASATSAGRFPFSSNSQNSRAQHSRELEQPEPATPKTPHVTDLTDMERLREDFLCTGGPDDGTAPITGTPRTMTPSDTPKRGRSRRDSRRDTDDSCGSLPGDVQAPAPVVRAAGGAGGKGTPRGESDEELCFVCFDHKACCVFMECGHAGVCRPCANKLWACPPHQCPTCRQKISLVVELTGERMFTPAPKTPVASPVRSPAVPVYRVRRSFDVRREETALVETMCLEDNGRVAAAMEEARSRERQAEEEAAPRPSGSSGSRHGRRWSMS